MNWLTTDARRELYNSFAVLERKIIFDMPLKESLLDLIQSANSLIEEETDYYEENS